MPVSVEVTAERSVAERSVGALNAELRIQRPPREGTVVAATLPSPCRRVETLGQVLCLEPRMIEQKFGRS